MFTIYVSVCIYLNFLLYFVINRDKNGVLTIETEMFERFYKKQDTSSLTLAFGPVPHAPSGEATRPTGRKRSKVRYHAIDRTIRLTTEQKCNIAQKEVERIKEEMAKAEENSEKILDMYKVRQRLVKDFCVSVLFCFLKLLFSANKSQSLGTLYGVMVSEFYSH